MIDALLGEEPVANWQMYTPVLRAKASEWKAMAALTRGVRLRIAPIIEFVPHWKEPGASTTSRRRRAAQTPAEYVRRFLESCVTATPAASRSFVYFGLAGSEAMWSGIDLWSEYEARVPSQVDIVPLADLRTVASSPALARVARARSMIGLRVEAADVSPQLLRRIADALRALGTSPSAAHIIADLKDAPDTVSHSQLRAALGNPSEFASVVLLAGVFPQDVTHYEPGVTPEPRREWQAWWRDHVGTPAGERLLSFGDYTTQCALYQPSPEVPGSVSLRYTIDNATLVFRGRQSNGSSGLGHEQMHGHCRLLVSRPDYDGAAFSVGDQSISCWTNPANGPGNAMQWRTAAIIHHITHVVVQLQDTIGSSATVRTWARVQAPAPCS